MSWIKFDPRRSQHEVDVTLELIAPEFDNSTQVELADDIMRLDQSVHVGLESMVRVNALLIKLNLDKAIRVRANDEVDLGPVHHDHLFDVVDDIG